MAYPISSTRTERSSARAFTLVEVMVAAGIGSFILTGVVSTFLMIGRTGANTANYFDLESNARQGLEAFGREVRNASNVTAFTGTSVTLTIPKTDASNDTTNDVLYSATYSLAADPDPEFSGQNALVRSGPPLANPYNPDGTVAASVTTTLIHYVQSSATIFKYFSLVGGYISGPDYGPGGSLSTPLNEIDPASLNSAGIKQIELTLTAQRSNSTVVTATNTVLSACFTLRNK
jgi:type II secretory pathway pseudopilin PulG